MYMKSCEISYLRVAKVVDTIADEYFLCIGYFSHLRLKVIRSNPRITPLIDIADNQLAVMHSWLLDFGERD